MYFQIYTLNSMCLNYDFFPRRIKRLNEFNSTNDFVRRFTDEFNFLN